ncbi:hypothetical protein BDZ45DRAFT_668552 [Acephala macrosclerotiorum]|nr:hypothetical protein BDZ45DRAFT_668552 [Acephala macrosclerotiorum]
MKRRFSSLLLFFFWLLFIGGGREYKWQVGIVRELCREGKASRLETSSDDSCLSMSSTRCLSPCCRSTPDDRC